MKPIDIQGVTPLLQVFNMPRSLAFYRGIFGFEVISDSGDADDSSWVWLRLNGCDIMLNDQYEPGHVPPECPNDRVRWHGDTCLYFGCPDVDAAYEYLRSNGIDSEAPKNAPYGMRQLYVTDPDGYNLCFQHSVET